MKLIYDETGNEISVPIKFVKIKDFIALKLVFQRFKKIKINNH